jgi:nucleoid-associated protein Lsr2
LSVAKETFTRLIDDLDGGVAHETVSFGLDGHTYQIDLSTKHAKKLRADLAPYVEVGSRVSIRGGRAGGRARAASADKDINRSIREWAIAKGYDIAPRGRIRQEIVEEYHRTGGR